MTTDAFDDVDFDLTPPTDDFIRDGYGRPVIDGIPYTRVSTLADSIDSKVGLRIWRERHMMLAIARCPDLRLRLQGLTYADGSEISKIIDEALTRAKDHGTDPTGSLRKANYGTAIHSFLATATEPQLSDDEPEIEAVIDVLRLREDVLKRNGFVDLYESHKIVCHLHRYAGTNDTILLNTESNTRHMSDAKSGKPNFKSAIVQLSGYASGDGYDLLTKNTSPLFVSRDVAYIEQIDVAAGTFELVEVNIGPGRDGISPIELAVAVHGFNSAGHIKSRSRRVLK